MKRRTFLRFSSIGISSLFIPRPLLNNSILDESEQSKISLESLKTEYLDEPIGIEVNRPRFSGLLKTKSRAVHPICYQLWVAKSRKDLAKGSNLLWNSGSISISNLQNIEYKGSPLKNNMRYYWKMKALMNNGYYTPWSEIATFHIGYLDQNKWQAKWIGSPDQTKRTPYMRKEFNINKSIKSANAYVTGVGYYEYYLNSHKIGTRVLDPVPSQYQERIYYATFDISDELKEGMNAMGLILGEGQAAINISKPERYHNRARKYPGIFDRPMGIVQVDIMHEDGTQDTIISDESWSTGSGLITYSDFYGGEDYDSTKEITGWSKPGFDDGNWEKVKDYEIDGTLTGNNFEPIRVCKTIKPISKVSPESGVEVYDLGQDIGGCWRLTVKGKAGTIVKIRGAETIDNQYFPKQLNNNSRISTIYKLGSGHYERDAFTTYTIQGSGREHFEPKFFYSGFRYIQVEVDRPQNIESLKIEGRTIHSDVEQKGYFRSSNEILNQIHKNMIWTIKNILQGAPMSNPNSEKNGWTGDVHLYAEPANLIFDMPAFWTKWLQDIKDSQSYYGDGRIVSTIPNYRKAENPTSPAWGAAYPLLVWYTYQYYGDKRVLKRHLKGIKAWCDSLTKKSDNYIIKDIWADHVAPGFDKQGNPISFPTTPEITKNVGTAYYYETANILSKIARVLHKEKIAERYNNLASGVTS